MLLHWLHVNQQPHSWDAYCKDTTCLSPVSYEFSCDAELTDDWSAADDALSACACIGMVYEQAEVTDVTVYLHLQDT